MSKIKLQIESKPLDKDSIDNIMKDCEQYREKLTRYCLQYFDCEYEYAEDCVQDAYVALYDNLMRGIKIYNYQAWLYKVMINYKNKVIKDKINRKEYDFSDNEEKDNALNNTLSYEPDYVENLITDKEIKKRSIKIVSSLNENERELYIEYYCNNTKLKDIAVQMDVSFNTIKKRHERLKNKIKQMIKEFEKM